MVRQNRPPFHADLTPNDPFFLFRTALCAFWEICTFCGNFNIKLANFGLQIAVLHTKWPPFLGICIKKIFFLLLFYLIIFYFELPQNDPFFNEILYRMPPTFVLQRHLYVTFIFESPPPRKQSIIFFNNSFHVARVKLQVFQIGVCVCGGGGDILGIGPHFQLKAYTVRPLFKKFTQHCETYEPTNCCVKKLHNLFKIVHKLCKIVHKLCNFFTQLLVGSYVSQCCVKF